MNSRISIIAVLLAIVFLQSCKSDEKGILKAFNGYKEGVVAADGVETEKYINQKTKEHYIRMFEMSITADSAEVAQESLMNKLFILSSRAKISKEVLLQLKPEEFFGFALENGLIGRETVNNLDLGVIEVDGKTGKGELISNGNNTGFHFTFDKEDGDWKIDLTEMLKVSESAMKTLMEYRRMSEADFIKETFATAPGNPGNEIWHPLQQK